MKKLLLLLAFCFSGNAMAGGPVYVGKTGPVYSPGSSKTVLADGSNPSTSSTSAVDMTGVTTTITTTKASRIGFALATSLRNVTSPAVTFVNIQVNGVNQFGANGIYHNQAVAGYFCAFGLSGLSAVLPAGTYIVKARWYVSTSTSTMLGDTDNSTMISAWEI